MTQECLPYLRLVYTSRATSAWAEDLDGVLFDILANAVPRNRARGVTSLLITHAGWILQVIEGPPEGARAAFAAMLDDERHRGAVLRVEETAPERLFPRWSMSGWPLSSVDAALVQDLAGAGEFDPATAPPQTLIRLLSIISKAHDHRLDAQQRMVVRR